SCGRSRARGRNAQCFPHAFQTCGGEFPRPGLHRCQNAQAPGHHPGPSSARARYQLSLSAHLRKRGAAASMDQVGHSSRGLASDRGYGAQQGLPGPADRQRLRSMAMRAFATLAAATLVAVSPNTAAQEGEAGQAARIERVDPALDALISPDASIERVATGFSFTEGPLWHD